MPQTTPTAQSGQPHGVGAILRDWRSSRRRSQLDLADTRGREIVLKLLAGADVFSEHFKAGTMDRLGLGVDVLVRLNPRLVTVAQLGDADGEIGTLCAAGVVGLAAEPSPG